MTPKATLEHIWTWKHSLKTKVIYIGCWSASVYRSFYLCVYIYIITHTCVCIANTHHVFTWKTISRQYLNKYVSVCIHIYIYTYILCMYILYMIVYLHLPKRSNFCLFREKSFFETMFFFWKKGHFCVFYVFFRPFALSDNFPHHRAALA